MVAVGETHGSVSRMCNDQFIGRICLADISHTRRQSHKKAASTAWMRLVCYGRDVLADNYLADGLALTADVETGGGLGYAHALEVEVLNGSVGVNSGIGVDVFHACINR